MITIEAKTTVIKREYLQIVELIGIIGGFFEVMWFIGVFIMGPYNRSAQRFATVKEVYGKDFLKEKTGFKSYCHYISLSTLHILK